MSDNTKEIRGLLSKIIGTDDRNKIIGTANQILSLLPPVCGECGGSGRKPREKHCSLGVCIKKHDRITCHPDGVQCEYYIPTESCSCQAPAGEVEEFAKRLKDEAHTLQLYDEPKSRRGAFLYSGIYKACTHLTAQQKQIEGQRKDRLDVLNLVSQWVAKADELQAKIKGLEAGAFGANEEAQIRNDRIEQLEEERKLYRGALLNIAEETYIATTKDSMKAIARQAL